MVSSVSINHLVDLAFSNNSEAIKTLLKQDKNIDLNQDSRFIGNVCANNNMSLLKYLLEEYQTAHPIDIHLDHERALCCAIYNNKSETNLDMVKYLLTSPNISEHSNLFNKYYSDYLVFQYIFKLKAYESSLVMINYLTLEFAHQIKNDIIYPLLIQYSDSTEFNDQIIKNLITSIDKEENKTYKAKLELTLCELLKESSLSSQMIDYLTLEVSSNKRESFIFSSLFNNPINEENEPNYKQQIIHNLLAVLYNEKESQYKLNLEKILISISSELYEKYCLKNQLNEQLVSNGNITSLHKI